MRKKGKFNIKISNLIWIIAIILPYIGLWFVNQWYEDEVDKKHKACFVIISKEDMNLRVFDYEGTEKMSFPIACGKALGNKAERGDLKTPEGVFRVSDIQDASTWKHDFNDGLGLLEGTYGPYFIRLEVPGHKGIGIHGTHKPSSIGTRDTEGCIRLHNQDLEELQKVVYCGMIVVVTTSYNDIVATHKKQQEKAI